MTDWNEIVLGSGFAGSLLARLLARSGHRVLLLERDRHPRFALGESSTPLASLSLERLARRFDAPDLLSLSTHGRWGRGLPELGRGLKRGFTFYRHRRGEPFDDRRVDEPRLLVTASPNDEVADVHWLRSDVDHHLVREAVRDGVDYRDGVEIVGVEIGDRGVVVATPTERFRADRVIDATGGARCLTRFLGLDDATGRMTVRRGLLAGHARQIPDFVSLARRAGAEMPDGPYPDERAAVHHLLDEGWVYVLPFDHGVASCGFVLRDPESDLVARGREDPDRLWRELLAPYPTLADQLADVAWAEPLRFTPSIAYRTDVVAGERWFLLPHASFFADPLFSTGIAWSLLGVERLLDLLTDGPGTVSDYQRLVGAEATTIERLVEAADLATRIDFDLFVAVTWLYFVTVSHAETVRRLVTPEQSFAWDGFLGAGDADTTALVEAVLDEVRSLSADSDERRVRSLRRRIATALAPHDVIGIDLPQHWRQIPVDLDLLVDRHDRVGLDREAIMASLPRLRGEHEPSTANGARSSG